MHAQLDKCDLEDQEQDAPRIYEHTTSRKHTNDTKRGRDDAMTL